MGPASAGVAAMQPALQLQHFTQPMQQPGPSTGHNPVDSLIQQLLLGPAGHSSSLLQASMAPPAAAPAAAPPGAAAASSARVSSTPAATLPNLKSGPNAAAAAAPCASGIEAGQVHKSAREAVALQLGDLPQQSHTPWLKAQLQLFAANGLKVAQHTAAATASEDDGGLLGRRVGFMLLDEMQVLGPRNILLTLPPGFYEGLAVKYLGSSCQADVCEAGCAGQHQFYRARILQPRAVPTPSPSSSVDDATLAASLSQAEAATSGRPVLLILDLHPRLRAGSLQELLQVESAEQLQDAWVLVEVGSEGPSSQPEAGTCRAAVSAAAAAATAAAAAAAAAATNKRGRKPGVVGKPGQVKKARM